MTDTNTSHVVILDDGPTDILHLHCERCGADLRLKLPVSVDEMAAANDAFVARHKGCEERSEKA